MNLLVAPGWSSLRDDDDSEISEKPTEYDIIAGAPEGTVWAILHENNARAKAHVEKHTRLYLKNRRLARWAGRLLKGRSRLHDMKERKTAREKRANANRRFLVGCTVNVSALGSSPRKDFDKLVSDQ